jgi:hypothetical protein
MSTRAYSRAGIVPTSMPQMEASAAPPPTQTDIPASPTVEPTLRLRR